MKIRMTLIFVIGVLIADLQAQISINSVTFNGGYALAGTKKSGLKVNSMNGYGGGLEVRFNLYKNLKFSLNAGYKELKIDQEPHALFAEWNWKTCR